MAGPNVNVRNLQGETGATYIDNTDEHTGEWCAIQVVEAGEIDEATASNIEGTLENVPLPLNAVIFGRFTAIKLSSGKIFAYKS